MRDRYGSKEGEVFTLVTHGSFPDSEPVCDVLEGVELVEKKGLEYILNNGGVYAVKVDKLMSRDSAPAYYWRMSWAEPAVLARCFHETFCASYKEPLKVRLWDGVRAEVIYSHSMIWVFIDLTRPQPLQGFCDIHVLGDEVIDNTRNHMHFSNNKGLKLKPCSSNTSLRYDESQRRRLEDLVDVTSASSVGQYIDRYGTYAGKAYSLRFPYSRGKDRNYVLDAFLGEVLSWKDDLVNVVRDYPKNKQGT